MLEGRNAVITGAGRGIGRAIAELFVQMGAHVTLNDVDSAPLEEVARACDAVHQGRTRVLAGSVADPAHTDALMKLAAEGHGAIDVLINNAGVTRDRVIHKMTDEDWTLVLDVNLRGTFNGIRSVAPYMREVSKRELEQRGDVRWVRKIVNFCSTAAIRGNPGQANYTAAKMGNIGLTRTIAQEWAPYRIAVNAVAPGFTETRLTQSKQRGDVLGIPEDIRTQTLARIPFGRFGTPSDVAQAVLFFASPMSDYVTGQEINVSGGLQIP